MNSWMRRAFWKVARGYFDLAEVFAIVFLAILFPLLVVAELMDLFHLGQLGRLDAHGVDQGALVVAALAIFLLVLKIARDTEEIKARISVNS